MTGLVWDNMIKSYRETNEILDSLLEYCKGDKLSEVIFEIQRAKLLCFRGINCSSKREAHQRNFEQLRFYQGVINKLAEEFIRERKIRKLLVMLDGAINGLMNEIIGKSIA